MTVEILTSPERRRRWSTEEKARVVAEAKAPGLWLRQSPGVMASAAAWSIRGAANAARSIFPILCRWWLKRKRQRSHAVNFIEAQGYAARRSWWLTARTAFQFHGRSSASRLIGWPLAMRSIISAM
jgi:hypothetical protein